MIKNENVENYFVNREIAYQLIDDTYCRFRSFNNSKEFKEHILNVMPVRMEFGAIYNMSVENLFFAAKNILAEFKKYSKNRSWISAAAKSICGFLSYCNAV